jgi:hypothetical protein
MGSFPDSVSRSAWKRRYDLPMAAPDMTCNPISNVVAKQWDVIHTGSPTGICGSDRC